MKRGFHLWNICVCLLRSFSFSTICSHNINFIISSCLISVQGQRCQPGASSGLNNVPRNGRANAMQGLPVIWDGGCFCRQQQLVKLCRQKQSKPHPNDALGRMTPFAAQCSAPVDPIWPGDLNYLNQRNLRYFHCIYDKYKSRVLE